MNYYDKDGIVVRRSVKADVIALKDKIKKSDVDEIWRSHHLGPYEALKHGIDKSILCLTVQNGSPIAMFGIHPDMILGYKASVWFLSSEEIFKMKMRFLRNCRMFIEMMLDFYPYLYNYVDVENETTIKWLKYLGAKFGETKPYGSELKPFIFFYFEREL